MPALWSSNYSGLQQFITKGSYKNADFFNYEHTYRRLGKLAEILFSYWVKTQPDYKIIVENLQIIHQKQTIGELDVILFNSKSESYIHLELITKFYLYNPVYNPNDINAWIGPNRNDSLKNKIEKLANKQLPLLYHKVTQKKLADFGLTPEMITQQVCFKAWLFVPLNFNKNITTFNAECIAGNYLTLSEFIELHNEKTTYFCPKKQNWLQQPETQKEWFLLNNVLIQIRKLMDSDQAIMVWTQYKNTYKRYIIVPYDEISIC